MKEEGRLGRRWFERHNKEKNGVGMEEEAMKQRRR